jgi:hypothetical protein
MTAEDKTQRDAGSIHAERIGKVFVAVGHATGLSLSVLASRNLETDCNRRSSLLAAR